MKYIYGWNVIFNRKIYTALVFSQRKSFDFQVKLAPTFRRLQKKQTWKTNHYNHHYLHHHHHFHHHHHYERQHQQNKFCSFAKIPWKVEYLQIWHCNMTNWHEFSITFVIKHKHTTTPWSLTFKIIPSNPGSTIVLFDTCFLLRGAIKNARI